MPPPRAAGVGPEIGGLIPKGPAVPAEVTPAVTMAVWPHLVRGHDSAVIVPVATQRRERSKLLKRVRAMAAPVVVGLVVFALESQARPRVKQEKSIWAAIALFPRQRRSKRSPSF